MTVSLIRGDARSLPLADDTVDLVVTSPPYFALRSYQDGGEHYAGQIGSESTPAEFVAALLDVTRECIRVLKPTGSLFVNLGDKYSGAQAQNTSARKGDDSAATWRQTDPKRTGIPNKSLMGIPWRYALACIDDLGLVLRAEIIWSKPNGLPESVTDRVRRSHEQWFHFTLQPRYYSAIDEIREAHSGPWKSPGGGTPAKAIGPADRNGHSQWERTREERDATVRNPLGKLPGSVWTVPTEPLIVPPALGIDHFAAFPTEFPRRIIQGWSPPGVCCECGEGRRPCVIKTLDVDHFQRNVKGSGMRDLSEPTGNRRGMNGDSDNGRSLATITGYACMCPDTTARTTPAVVLDPFGGTGTTALVASVLDRHGISVDMSADYCRLAQWRTTDPDQRAKAARVEKPPKQLDGQLDLFEEPA